MSSAKAQQLPTLGYIGLGNLGANLANQLLKAGYRVLVHDTSEEPAKPLIDQGAVWSASPSAMSMEVDCLFTCLPSPAISEKILQQIIPAHKANLTWIENSTLSRDDVLKLNAQAAPHGIFLLEAPVTGGVHLAARGEITVLAGGDEALFERHKTLLQVLGKKLFYMGPLGSAAVIKVITNMLAFIHLVADGEALMLAKRSGLDLGMAWRAIAASSGTSFVHETEGQLILNGSYDIAFSMDLALKDLGFAMGFGQEFNVPMELAELTHDIFQRGRAAYGGKAQSTQIVKLLEDALGTDLRAGGFPPRLV